MNCTGTYPETTLRPARSYRSQIPDQPVVSQTNTNTFDSPGRFSEDLYSTPEDEWNNSETNGGSEQVYSDDSQSINPSRPAWFSQISRVMGLAAILIVGVIPLAAVCLALSLFYSLDNQSQFVWSGNFATQTANAAASLPTITPEPTGARTSETPSNPTESGRVSVLPLVLARVAFEKGQQAGSTCTPEIVLSLDAPADVGGRRVPAGSVIVSRAGTNQEVASGTLEPGAAPFVVELGAAEQAERPFDWFIQVEHPWLDFEAIILTGSTLEDCGSSQVSIEYHADAEMEAWLAARDAATAGDLGMTWKLLTWGPDALEGQDWVAAVKLSATGGNGSYVYFAEGDLTNESGASVVNGLLPDDHMVLGQKSCLSGVARVGVTSAGQILHRVLAVRLVTPECR
jgi:hypothetical protein